MIPLSPRAHPAGKGAFSAPGSDFHPVIAAKPRLLLVDDEPRALTSLQELLQRHGYHLTLASTGGEALAHLADAQFDLVLLDLRLPDLSGHQVMDCINQHAIDAKVIVLSGRVEIDAAIGSLKRGAYDYLRKPYSQEELFQTIHNALGQHRLEQANRRIARQLEKSERMYRYMVDASPDIIYMLDHEGRFTFVNDRACALLGYRREELIGSHYAALVVEDDLDRACHVFNERRAGERASRNVELRVRCRAGAGPARAADAAVMTISLNAIGMHLEEGEREPSAPAFVGTYGIARDVTSRKRAEEVIYHQAYHDILTGLPNRTLFKDRLGQAILQARRKDSEVAVMFIDLDRFKLVNDTLGHVKGDDLLQQVAARLKDCLRKGDTLARQGGDEFTIVLPELRGRADAGTVAAKFLERLHQPFDLDGNQVHISGSIGIAIYPEHGDSIDALLRHADIAMYAVKGEGKNGHAFYDPSMQEASHRKIALEQSLRKALERGELEMYYQPQVDAASGRIVGAEALMRWNHPVRGVLLPDEFLPLAEENGMMLPISEWMIGAVCGDMVRWMDVGDSAFKLSLNLSPQYLDRGDFFDKMRAALALHGIAPGRIEVEITENICIRNPQHAIEQLGKLGQLGVSVAIDDFGTGYSSLAYLHRFPVQTIKIDQSFVQQIGDEHGHYPVVLAIISISRGLHLHLVAEGVETEVQARYLRAHGCPTMQGFLFHRPMPLAHFVGLLPARCAACGVSVPTSAGHSRGR
jgi:diguanylate cyclase (GGDEF)-like protein/PAS domain S-box-containing protein